MFWRRKRSDISLYRKKYLLAGGRLFAFLKTVPSFSPKPLTEQFYIQARLRGFFEAIYKAKIPLIYVLISKPRQGGVEMAALIGSWEDFKDEAIAISRLEENLNVIKASFSVAIPSMELVRVEGSELAGLWDFASIKGERAEVRAMAAEASALFPHLEPDPAMGGIPARPRFYVPPPNSGRGLKVGRILVDGASRHDFRLDIHEVMSHVCIMGMTGAGKTNTTKVLIEGLALMGIPVLVLDIHNEYRDVMEKIGGTVVAPGKDEFVVNPVAPFDSRDVAEHVALVTDIFSDVYRFTYPQSFIFRSALMKLLSEDESVSGYPHTLSGLIEAIETHPVKSAYDNETKLALLRRLLPLVEGQAGRALNGKSTVSLEELLKIPVAVQLGHFKDFETRAIFSSILLKMIFDYKVSRGVKGVPHVTVIEEARHVVPPRRREEPPSIGEKMINELRKFGEGMIFIAQFPSQISHEIIKNSSVKIVHRVSWAEDVNLLSSTLNLNPEQQSYLSHLETGVAVIATSGLPGPVLVKVDKFERPLSKEVDEFREFGYER